MKKSITFVLSFLALVAGGSNVDAAATISASLFSFQPAPGSTITPIVLTGITPPSHATITGAGYTVTFTNELSTDGVVQGAGPTHAIPVAGMSGGSPEYLTGGYQSSLTLSAAASGNYLSVTSGATITITFTTPQTGFALLWGSIDPGNTVTFNDVGNDQVTGTQVIALVSAIPDNQGPGGSAYVSIGTPTPFTTVTLGSNITSFESAGLAAGAFVTVPEPASVVMAGFGLAFVGLVGFRARRSR